MHASFPLADAACGACGWRFISIRNNCKFILNKCVDKKEKWVYIGFRRCYKM
jgi:hypothetical protein